MNQIFDHTGKPAIGNSQNLDAKALSGFSGANYSPNRGYVYFPTLDTKRQLDTFSRSELTRRSRFLYENVGIAKRAIDGAAGMIVGTGIIPQARTKDTQWNSMAEKAWKERSKTALAFDVAGKYNYRDACIALLKHRFKDGDMAAVFSKSASGRAMVNFYEGHQVVNPDTISSSDWFQGVLTNAQGRAVAYNIRGGDGKNVQISARDLRLHCDLTGRRNAVRGVHALAHAINNLLDITETVSYMKSGVKTANMVGYYLTQQQSGGDFADANSALAGVESSVAHEDGNITINKVHNSTVIPALPAGQDLKMLLDSRPHPNNLGMFAFLIRDIAWGMDLPPETLWDIATVGGAGVRSIGNSTQLFINNHQDLLISQFCSPTWIYFIASEMETGNLPRPQDDEWWAHDFQRPARQSVDFGRDGRVYKEMHERGHMTASEMCSMRGKDFEETADKYGEEAAYWKQVAIKNGLTMEELFRFGKTQEPLQIEQQPNNSE